MFVNSRRWFLKEFKTFRTLPIQRRCFLMLDVDTERHKPSIYFILSIFHKKKTSNPSVSSFSLSHSLSVVLVVAPLSWYSRARSVPIGTSVDVFSLKIHLLFMRTQQRFLSPHEVSFSPLILLSYDFLFTLEWICINCSICFLIFALIVLLFSNFTMEAIIFFNVRIFSVDLCFIILCKVSSLDLDSL